MRIPTLLQKIAELSEHPEKRGAIDVDLMLDYTRVLYADLLEWRSKLPATLIQSKPEPAPIEPGKEIKTTTPAAVLASPKPAPAATSIKDEEASTAKPHTTLSSAGMPDIRNYIGINERYQILSVLFGNDKAAYENALNYINTSPDAETAIGWLQEHLWIAEEVSDGAQQAFDIIRRFFTQK